MSIERAIYRAPRRRSELGLMLVGGIVVIYASLLPSLAITGQLPLHEVSFLVGVFVIGTVVQVANRRYAPDSDPIILPIALVLNGLGYVVVGRLSTASYVGDDSGQQAAWTAVGIAVYIAVLALLRRSRDLERYRYLMLAVALALLVAPLMPVIGLSEGGARLWVHLKGYISFQPVEIAKLLLVFFFASYFIERRELLTVPTRRVGNHLVPDLRAFGPVAVAGAFSLVVILGEHDIGFSLLLFVVFLSMLWVSTGRVIYLVAGIVLFVLGTYLASHVLSQLSERISIWLNPWADPKGLGYQPIAGELSFGRGGLFGSGLGLGLSGVGNNLPAPQNDFIFAVIGEELGLFGTVAISVAYLLIVGSGMRAALTARSEFAKLVAFGLTILFGFQAFLIMAGVTRLLPLTGVTLPFVSYGGSSLVANYALLAVLMRISNEANQPDVGYPTWSSTSSDTTIGAGRR